MEVRTVKKDEPFAVWHRIRNGDLPPKFQDVLIATKYGTVKIGYYNEDTELFCADGGYYLKRDEVLAWAEVPHYRGK